MRPILLALVGIAGAELASWGWMSPPPGGAGEPVLAFRLPATPAGAVATRFVPLRIKPEPEVVAASLPPLGATTGTAVRLQFAPGVDIHFSFFE